MALGKVARRTVVADVAALLDSPELTALIAELDEYGDKRGRKGYGARALLGSCLVKSLFALPTWTFVAALIAEHPGLQDALGGSPSCWAMYRFSTKLRKNRPAIESCLDSLAESLREQHPDFGRDVAIDASDIPATRPRGYDGAMRMSIRRFTRLTNAFSKKVENHAAAVSLHFAYYNYCRPHQSLGGNTPAMAARLEDHVWTVDELIALLSAAEATPIKRGTYRKTRERKARERAAEISN